MRRFFYFLSAGMLTLILTTPPAARGQALVTSEPHLAIPDDGAGPACVDTVSFAPANDTIGAFRVGLAIQHTYQAQLRVLLLPPGVVWPSATYAATDIPSAVTAGAIELVANAGGSSDDLGQGLAQPYDYLNFTSAGDPLFDPGATAMSIDTAPDASGLSGTWLAHDPAALQSVYGGDPADFGGQGGTWTLVVIDDTATEDGTLVAWQVEYDVIAGDPPEILLLRGGPVPDGGSSDLGLLTTGVPETVTFNVGNTGLGMLHVTAVTTAAATNCTVTAIPSVPFTVGPSDASPLDLEVTPLGDGPFSFDLRLANNDADENPYRVHVTGTAETPDATQTGVPELVIAGSTSFRANDVGAFDSALWTVSNGGDADLIITNVDTIGAHASAFAVSGLDLPATIPPGGSASLQVFFAPTANRSYAAAVRFTSNHGAAPGTTTEMSVTGFVTPQIEDPSCNCSGAGGPDSGLVLGLLVMMLLGWRRRQRSKGAR